MCDDRTEVLTKVVILVKALNQVKVINIWVRVPLAILVLRVPGLLLDDPGFFFNLLIIGDSRVFNFFLSGDLGVQRVPVQPAALEKSSRYFGRSVPGKGAAPSIQPKF